MAHVRGKPLSSAILYLAIVVIWACILVPRWVRRTHLVVRESPKPADLDEELTPEVPGSGIDAAAAMISETLGEAPRRMATGFLRSLRESSESSPGSTDPPESVAYQSVTYQSVAYRSAAYESTAHESAARQSAAAQSAAGGGQPLVLVRPQIGRGRILQARRRMMTTLVTLAIAAVACAASGLTSAWVCLPPAGMLGMYVLLLREAARCDAESAHRHLEASRARAVQQRAHQASEAAREPERTAQIIDISRRVGDQLYDQYADATVRAVGD
jgi:hypothetical protein